MTENTQRIVSADTLRDLIERLLTAAGCGFETAMATADVLIEAELRGYGTHGLIRIPFILPRILEGVINPRAVPHIIEEREATALVDGDSALGPVGGIYAASLAIRKAEKAGSCTVGLLRANHLLMMGYYGERIARAGLVGIITSVTPPLAHPLGGTARILGTNPFVVAVPTESDQPVLLDFATTEIPFGKVLKAKAQGVPIPEGAALGPDGKPTTDASRAAEGALTPWGGYKGFGLNFVLGLLAGPLLGGAVGREVVVSLTKGKPSNKGDLFIAIDPASFGDPAVFRKAVSAHIRELKESPKAEGVENIRIPGERSFAEKERRLREGIPVDEGVWAQVAKVAEDMKVSLPL